MAEGPLSDPRLGSGQQVAVVTPLVAEVGHAEVVVDPSVAVVGQVAVDTPLVVMVGHAEAVWDHLVVVVGRAAEDPQAEVNQQEAMSLQSFRRCQRWRHSGATEVALKTSFL